MQNSPQVLAENVSLSRACSWVSSNLVARYLAFVVLLSLATLAKGTSPQPSDSLLLSNPNTLYDVNSAQQASGLYACPQGLTRTDLASSDSKIPDLADLQNDQLQNIERAALKTTTLPKFKQNHRYCFFIKVRNETEQNKWKLHFSNFFIDRIDVSLFDGSTSREYRSDWLTGISDEKINVLGRAFSLRLENDKEYFLAMELSADGVVAPPYFALMSEARYHTWSTGMNDIYISSVGVILGLILVALLCSAILKDVTFFWFGISSLFLFSSLALRSHLGFFVFHSAESLSGWIWLWASATTLSILLFARSFLLPEAVESPLKKVFDVCIIYFFAVLLLSQFLPKNWNIAIYSLNAIIMMTVIFYAGIARVIGSGRYYLIFMLGWVPVLFSFLEHIAIVVIEPEAGESTLSYKILREPFYQIAHMLIHFVAMLIRIDTLKKEKYQAEMKNEAKSRFLASVSHDLRQPLHSMGMFLAHLNDHVNTKSGQNVLAKVYGLHAAMNDSFNKLMDLSRLEAGAVKLNTENIDLSRLIARMRLEFEPYACTKGLKIRFKSTVKSFNSDPVLFERILRNLLTNAIKYTEQGGVLVGFRTRKNHLLIQVRDTGCGISADDQGVIFDIYERSEKTSSSHKGMGIGLAIVKHLVDLLGGTIDIKSEEKKGTLFQIKLSYTEALNQEFDHLTDKSVKTGLRIVLDLPNNQARDQVSGSLKNWGYLTAGESQDEGVAPITLIITECDELLTAESMSKSVSNFEEQYGNVVIAMFCDNVERELAAKLTALNVHILSAHYRPAQLRSLIRYLESFLLKKQP